MEYSHLEVTRKTSPLGKVEQETYKWVGKSPYVRISWLLVDEFAGSGTKEIQIGPYKLLLVSENFLADVVTYVRKDKLGRLRVLWYRATRWLDLAYRRFIITLAVWQLAEFHAACIPSWRDIKIFRKGKK